MTDKSKKILIILIGSVALVFLLAFIAIGAFILGRNSADADEQNRTIIVDEAVSPIENELSESAPTSSPDGAPPAAQDSEGDQSSASQLPAQSSDSDAEVDSSSQTSDVTSQEEKKERVPVDIDSIDGELFLEVWEIINREFDGFLPSSSEITYESIKVSM